MKRARREESGLTLIELVIGIVLLSLITGALSSAFVTAFHLSGAERERVKQSDDAQAVAAFLVRDAQSAGGINPLTASRDDSLGVAINGDDGGCTTTTVGAGAPLFRFKWLDRSVDSSNNQVSTPYVANYYFISDPTAPRIERTTCAGPGLPQTSILGNDVLSATPSCDPTCSGNPLPDTVSLDVTGTTAATVPGYHYKVTASLRVEGQSPPCTVLNDPACPSDSGTSIPLLALGGGVCVGGTDTVGVAGSTTVHIYGGVIIDATDVGTCSAMGFDGNPTYTSGAVSILNGGTCDGCPFSPGSFPTKFPDPYAGLTEPGDTCGTGSNPAPTNVAGVLHYHPGTYPTVLTVNSAGTVVFDTGTYVFCAGLNFAGATTTSGPGGVLFFVKGGTISKTGNADVTLSPMTTGNYAGLLIWQRAQDTTSPMSFQGNGPLTLNGTLYAPTIEVQLLGTVDTSVRSIVAGRVTFGGNHTVGVGVPPPPLVISSPASLPDWTVGRPYPAKTVTVSGGSGINTFSAINLPNGMSINATSGVISGTPTVAGTFTATITDTDSFGDISTRPYTFTINSGPSISAPLTLPDWTINRDYPGTAITGAGGTTPYSWSATNLPAGLSINSASGVVGGTPSATGTSTAVIKLTDASGATTTRSYTFTIHSPPTITGPGSLPAWTANSAYPSRTMTGTNGTTPYTWSASSLPVGLTIDAASGVISGTPTTAGTYNVVVTLKDTAGASDTQNYSVVINPAPGIATAALPNGEQGRPYSFTLTPTPGTPPYTWSSGNGPRALPPGLSVNSSTGVISGTPSAAGSYTPRITITDTTNTSTSKDYDFAIAQPVAISGPATLPNWTINRDYPGTAITATNGVSPFTWSAVGLPAGLGIDSSTGVVSGTPGATGTFNATVTVTDALGGAAARVYTFTINANPAITPTSLPDGVQAVPYSKTLSATLGTPFAGPVYHWTISGLPGGSGLSIGLTTGVLSGTPNVSGTFSVTVTAQDAAGATDSKTFALTINPPPTATAVSPNVLPQGSSNKTITISGTGFASGAQVSFSGTGVTVNSSSFVDAFTVTANISISGAAAVGSRNVTVTNPDTSSATFTNAFSVTAAPTVSSANPASRAQGAANQNITITGSNFVSGAQAGFSGTGITVNSTTFVDSTTLTANVDIDAAAPTGARNVTVTNPDSGSATRAGGFTVNAAPSVTSVNPSSRAQGLTQNVTITGTGFANGAVVAFSGGGINVNSTTFNTGISLTANITIAAGATLGTHDVTVTNPDGGSATGVGIFTVNAPPTITSINPDTAPNQTASVSETITGSGFQAGATVTFTGSKPPTTTSAVTVSGGGTQLSFTITVPKDNSPPSTYSVVVSNPDGGSVTLTNGFTVT
jgi:hypothetical protein